MSTVGLMSANGLRLTLDVEVQGVALPVRHSVGGDAGVEAGPGLLDWLEDQGLVAEYDALRHILLQPLALYTVSVLIIKSDAVIGEMRTGLPRQIDNTDNISKKYIAFKINQIAPSAQLSIMKMDREYEN